MNNYVTTIVMIAFRNLARHKVKTIITVLAIIVSVLVFILSDAWVEGENIDSRRNMVNYETGAAKIQTRLYFEKKDELPMYENFTDWEVYANVLREVGFDTAPRFVFTGTLYSQTGSAPVTFNAIDPEADARLLRYSAYVESGRFIESGNLEMVLGTGAADKLKTGIPQRLTIGELEQGIILYGKNEGDRDFIRSLYEPVQVGKQQADEEDEEEKKLVLKKDLPQSSIDRFWELLADGGRMALRISTVIDIKELPQTISKLRFDVDIDPYLSQDEREIVLSFYSYDSLSQMYNLIDDDEITVRPVLNILVHHNYSGAIRHVNQLIDVRVVGVINSPDPQNNFYTAYIPLDALQDETGLLLDGHITELLVRKLSATDAALPGAGESPELIQNILVNGLRELGKEFPAELAVYSWLDYASDLLSTIQSDSVQTRFMSAVLFILSFIGIANAMLMSILERTKEIGMLRAMGMTDRELIITYMTEAGFVGLIGSVIGIILACLINIPLVNPGLDLSSMFEGTNGNTGGYRIASIFRSTWRPMVIIGTGVGATLLSAIMAFLPVRRSIKKPVAESLRFE